LANERPLDWIRFFDSLAHVEIADRRGPRVPRLRKLWCLLRAIKAIPEPKFRNLILSNRTFHRVLFRDQQTQTSAHKPAHFPITAQLTCVRYVPGNERKK
jgi:hypothetical protein